MISESNGETLLEELKALNLKHYIPEIAKNIAQSKLSARDQHTTIEICVLMHQRYETFAEHLIPAIETQYKQTPVSEFTKKRNILRHLTELYFKGIFTEYKLVFKQLNALMSIKYEDNAEEFCNAMMVLCDYLKTYGETVFLILSRDYRQSIEDGYEVTIERYEFLNV